MNIRSFGAGVILTATALLPTGVAGAAAPSGYLPPSTADVTEFPLPTGEDSRPVGITRGPDGNLWVAEPDAHKIARVTPSGGVTEFAVAGAPGEIVVGSDGNLWFTEPGAPKDPPAVGTGKVGRLTPDGTLTEWNTPGRTPGNFATLGPDGNVWFLGGVRPGCCRIMSSVAPDGTFNDGFVLPCCGGIGDLVSAGGYLWLFRPEVVLRMTTDGEFTDFPLPDYARPVEATIGPDGNMWFTDNGTCGTAGVGDDRIWRMTTGGDVTEFPLLRNSTCPVGITSGPDGNLWFTQRASGLIGRMTPGGKQTDIRIPNRASVPVGVAGGPDGKIWFTDSALGQVDRLDPSTITAPPGPCMVITGDTTLKGDVGPCSGDGIVVKGNNLTLNLNGHRILGNGKGYGDFAGVHLNGASGVTVLAGKPGAEVSGFDTGVWIDGGSGNTVRNLSIHDNLAADPNALLGDGVLALHSDRNTIRDNVIAGNGMFDNVAILGVDSNYNTVQGNEIRNAANGLPGEPAVDSFGNGTGLVINPFFEINNPRRGESITGNNILSNSIHDNANSGITNLSNRDALISKNTVSNNGHGARDEFGTEPDPGNGIGVQGLFTAVKETRDTVDSNKISGNAGAGIDVVHNQNVVRSNSSTGNAASGIQVWGTGNRIMANATSFNGSRGFDAFDLYDRTFGRDCDSNTWLNNSWGSGGFFPDCVAIGGSGPKPKPTTAPQPETFPTAPRATLSLRGKRNATP